MSEEGWSKGRRKGWRKDGSREGSYLSHERIERGNTLNLGKISS